ncbi:MAG: helix-turn-helix transcriptional regulator, partial [bacterium]|nr:helix-turn-helix transcriptional regulator [bacterium]
GERLNQVRLLLKKSQKEMARDLDFPLQTIKDLEAGRLYSRPYYPSLHICYGINLSWLTTGSGLVFSEEKPIVPATIHIISRMHIGFTPQPDHLKEVFQMEHLPPIAYELCDGLKELYREIKANAKRHPTKLSDWGFRITQAPFVPNPPHSHNIVLKLPVPAPQWNIRA